MEREDMTSFGVVIGTFGDPKWRDLAVRRALRSVNRQTRPAEQCEVVHAGSLAEARNRAVDHLRTDWVVFLDADDELDPGYLAAMQEAADVADAMAADGWSYLSDPSQRPTAPPPRWRLLQPATLGVYANGTTDAESVVIPEAPSILDRNHLVIGTAVPRELFFRVGGFYEWRTLEDWEFFIRCYLVGARSVAVPEAIYRVHVSSAPSRNRQQKKVSVDTYREIRRMHMKAAKERGVA